MVPPKRQCVRRVAPQAGAFATQRTRAGSSGVFCRRQYGQTTGAGSRAFSLSHSAHCSSVGPPRTVERNANNSPKSAKARLAAV